MGMIVNIDLAFGEVMRSADRVMGSIEADIVLQDSFNTALMDGDFQGEARGYIDVRTKSGTLDAGLGRGSCFPFHGRVLEGDFGHVAALSNDFVGNAQALQYLEGARLQPVGLAGLQGVRLGVQA